MCSESPAHLKVPGLSTRLDVDVANSLLDAIAWPLDRDGKISGFASHRADF